MTPGDFISKWQASELKETAGSQSHFNDICAMLGVADPATADPKGEWFTFEKGATKTTGAGGWADVWRKGHFAWEYKGKKKNLDAAFAQLQQYGPALDNPPLLIVSDMATFRIHTNWTNTVQEVHEFALDDLADAKTRDLLLKAFTDPGELKPTRTRQALTEAAAQEFAALAQRLRERGHAAEEVAHFVNRLVFCMFAEDVRLLPDKMFTSMLKASTGNPDSFVQNAGDLFRAMAEKGGRIGFTPIDWFNGGLFDSADTLPLDKADIDNLIAAAELDWSDVDPSILGTLFERGLDPAKRSQLGAHYTDRDKIMQIVEPVIIRPLEEEWAEARGAIEALVENAPQQTADKLLRGKDLAKRTRALAKAGEIHQAFLERLAGFRVLDPACGSGNFLYLSLLALKDIEHKANLEAEALGLPREFPRVGPECVLGIELNPFAAELARVSVWIGEIQWMRKNGFAAAKNPILRPLGTIECRDAVLHIPPRHGEGDREAVEGDRPQANTPADSPLRQPSGLPPPRAGEDLAMRAEWPEADVVVGNPPFLGASRMISELGEEYTETLRSAWKGTVPGFADFVCFWFARAWADIRENCIERAGLVATNSIRGGTNREVLKPIVENGRIFNARSDEEWTVDGAAVRVSLICFDKTDSSSNSLDGVEVEKIASDLTATKGDIDLTNAERLSENLSTAFRGTQKGGPFDLPAEEARRQLLLPMNVNNQRNSNVIHRRYTGSDLSRRPADRWIIDFNMMTEQEAAFFEEPFRYVIEHVKPQKDKNRREWRRVHYWLHSEPSPGMREATSPLSRYIATPRVSKFRLFSWLQVSESLDDGAVAIARDDDTTFGILHSRFHELWALRMGTFLGKGNDPRYTPSTTFETFPFPEGLTPDIPAADYAGDPRAIAIAEPAARLNELRENWLNPPDLIRREPEVVEGYPDRILPVDGDAAKELKKRTLTNLYNARPAWLANAHAALDEVVADAYGWSEDWRAAGEDGLSEDEILARLFELNQERVGG